jgi:signal transduction histidine kinase/CheY-like chemotaxis protein
VKLRSKFLVSLLALTAGLTTASLLVVRRSVNAHARQEVLGSLMNASAVLGELQHRRDEAMQHSAALIANQPLLKAIVATSDPPTIQDASSTLWRSSGISLLSVADARGNVTAIHTAKDQISPELAQSLLTRTLRSDERQDWWLADGHLYRVFLSPIEAGSANESSTLGTLIAGYELDRQFAVEASQIASGDVVLRFGGNVIQSTLPSAYAASSLRSLHATFQRPQEVSLSDERFLASGLALDSSSPEGADIIVLKSYDQATAFVTSINQLIVGVGLGTVLLGTLIILFISHRFTKPLEELVRGVRALEKSDFDYPLHIGGKDEVSELTHSFDRMRRSVRKSQQGIVVSARMEAVGQLASGVAHDFNNLITIIKGYADLLSRKLGPDSPLANYVDHIQKAGDRATSVTRQLLAFSRKQVTQPQLLELNSLIANMNKMLRVLLGEHIEICLEPEPALDRIFADPGQIEQVILNLTLNARDAMPDGGKITVRTANRTLDQRTASGYKDAEAGRYVCISVADTGSGIDPETLARIFEPFFTTKETGKGTGLGLAIVAGVIKHLSGFVHVESQVGHGTTFQIFLPVKEAPVVVEGSPETDATPVHGSECILVVEDEDGVRSLLNETLTALGYTILQARNGEEGFEVFEKNHDRIKLVVTDMVMPKLGGLELINMIHKRNPGLKALILSGYTDRIADIERAKVPFLSKPFTPEALAARIRQLLAHSEAALAT